MTKKSILYLIILLVTAVLIAGGVLWYGNEVKKEIIKTNKEQVEIKISQGNQNMNTSDWKTYRNEEIGIAFEYPSEWGDIQENMGDTLCNDNQINNIEKEKCRRIILSVNNQERIFLVTETFAYTKILLGGPYGRGAAWYEKIRLIQKDDEDFCKNNPYLPVRASFTQCSTLKTKQGISVTMAISIVPFTENEEMTSYFVRSTNDSLYHDLIISSIELEKDFSGSGDDVKRLVESINFF